MVQIGVYGHKKREGFTFVKPSLSLCFSVFLVVGVAGFEPAAPCSQSRCANRTAPHLASFFAMNPDKSQA